MSSAGNFLKKLYVKRTPATNKIVHVYSSALKAMLTWHNMKALQVIDTSILSASHSLIYVLSHSRICFYQECREACGGQGLKTENRIGHLKGEFDVQLTFEGDNNILMQQVNLMFSMAII